MRDACWPCFPLSRGRLSLPSVPELPEVEVLVRHLAPLLEGRTIRAVRVGRAKVLAPASTRQFTRALLGAKFCGVSRRGKYLLFRLRQARRAELRILAGHLGMTGRMYLLPAKARLPRHAAVVLNLGRENFVFEDTRYFGRLTLDLRVLAKLGPEPLGPEFHGRAIRGRPGPFGAADQGQAAGPVLAGGRGEHLRQRGVVPRGHCADAAGAEIAAGAG